MEQRASFAGRVAGAWRRLRGSAYFWIFLGGLLLRMIYLWEAFHRNELIAEPIVDARVYVDWARDILAGKWLWYDARNYTPAFPIWLAGWISLTGWHPALHFAIFHLLGALQAVMLARTSAMIWHRRAGIFTGWIAALYWPLIVFEATYFAEAFAMFCFTTTLFLLVRWSREGRGLKLLWWAGFAFGWSLLARANAMLCVPVFAGWIVWRLMRERKIGWLRRTAISLVALLAPVALLAAPVVFWHWKLTGRPGLRTEGWLSVYLGNNPDYRGLVVPAGVRWRDFVYLPIRADQVSPSEQSDFWEAQTKRVLRERTADWLRLFGRKAVMVTGRFEIGQEIDLNIFRDASRVLSLPIWPGWGTLAPLALFAVLAAFRSPEARRGVPLMLCAAAYFASILPVQICGRYRLPMLIPLAPLAGWAASAIFSARKKRDARCDAIAASGALASCVLIWPDWLALRGAKIINHQFHVGAAKVAHGDETGALAAFEAGAKWQPADPDCPLGIGRILLTRGDVAGARDAFARSLANFPASHDAVLGLGECALAQHAPRETLKHVTEALRIAPNNMDALLLGSRAFAALGDWNSMAAVCGQMRSYPRHPASADFPEAWALTMAGRGTEALPIYDAVAGTRWFSKTDRARGAFLGGIVAWHVARDSGEAARRWQSIVAGPNNFFQPLARLLTGVEPAENVTANFPKDSQWRARQQLDFALGIRASLDAKPEAARAHFEAVVAARAARNLPPAEKEILEIWAIEELDRPPGDGGKPPLR